MGRQSLHSCGHVGPQDASCIPGQPRGRKGVINELRMPLAKSVAVIWQAVVEVLQQQLLFVRDNGSEVSMRSVLVGKRCMFRVGVL